jgi:Protein of unknown function (DUF2934)
MATERTKNTPVLPIGDQYPNLDDEIRRRAYELYEQRGRQDGYDMDDWLRAEAEVTRSAVKTIAAA